MFNRGGYQPVGQAPSMGIAPATGGGVSSTGLGNVGLGNPNEQGQQRVGGVMQQPGQQPFQVQQPSQAGPTPWWGDPSDLWGVGQDPGQGEFRDPGFGGRNAQFGQGLTNALAQSAPQVGGSQFAGQQQQLGNMLMGQANGTGPSLAQMQYRQASDQGLRQQQAMAASASPNNAAMAARLASQNMGNINQGLSSGLAQAGTQERMAAAGQLGNVLQGARGQDFQQGMGNAQLQQQQMQQNQQAAQGWGGLSNQNAQSQLQAQLGYEQNDTARYGIRAGEPGTFGQIMGALSPVLAMGGTLLGGPAGGAAGAGLGRAAQSAA